MSSNAYTVNIVNADELYVAGAKISGFRLGAVKEDGSNVGLNTNFPKLQLDISGTGAIRIPAGTTNNRNFIKSELISTGGATDLLGVLRYNKTTSRYEATYEHTGGQEPKWGNFVMEDSSGNVGIGTTTPRCRLDVSGVGMFKSPGGNNGLIVESDSSAVGINHNHIGMVDTSHNFYIQNHGTGNTILNYEGGNVGIGTTSPRCSLNITNTIIAGQGTIPNFTGNINNNSTCSLFLGKSVGTKQNYWGMWMGTIYETNGSHYGSYIQSGNDTNHYPILLNPNGGNVGIGKKNPGYKLDVNGSLYYASGGLNGSDDRIKHNEQSITNALSIISKLKPKHYIKTGTKLYEASHNFQLDTSGNPLDASGNPLEHIEDYTIETGIIAQEIKNIPELKFVVYGEEYKEKVINVYKKDASGNNILDASGNSIIENTITEMEPNTLCVDYNSIHCTHIAATQELDKIQQEEKTKLLEAEAKIAASEAKIAASEAKIAALENTLANVLSRLAALE